MLSALQIKNIAVIEQAELRFDAPFTVLTGETGAGKSIILDALNAALGERTSRELLRQGAQQAEVTALFTNCGDGVRDALDTLGIDFDGDVMIHRRITPDGRSACRINGLPVTVSMLRTVGSALVNIHGQHDSQALFRPDSHCGFLDALAHNDDVRTAYTDAFRALRDAEKERDALTTDEREKARQLDMLQFQIDELESADIRVGEREELQKRIALFRNSEAVLRALQNAYAALAGDEESAGGSSLFSAAADFVRDAADYFPTLQPIAEFLESAALDAHEYASDIRDCAESLQMDPRELQAAEDRLDLLYRLGRKYGESEEEMLRFLADAEAKAERIEHADARLHELETEIVRLSAAAEKAAQRLSDTRRKAGKAFAENVCRELSFLDMPAVRFVVRHEIVPLNANGADSIEFLLSANPGEDPRPLSKIASGGELSRIMLAIKNVLSACDGVDTLVFDEIDAGVSGSAAQKVGRKLAEVSRNHQVICVTHLAQIAVMADAHLLITKTVRDEKTYTAVTPLDFDGRVREIARIGAGSDLTQLQIDNAREMLLRAQESKQEG